MGMGMGTNNNMGGMNNGAMGGNNMGKIVTLFKFLQHE